MWGAPPARSLPVGGGEARAEREPSRAVKHSLKRKGNKGGHGSGGEQMSGGTEGRRSSSRSGRGEGRGGGGLAGDQRAGAGV